MLPSRPLSVWLLRNIQFAAIYLLLSKITLMSSASFHIGGRRWHFLLHYRPMISAIASRILRSVLRKGPQAEIGPVNLDHNSVELHQT